MYFQVIIPIGSNPTANETQELVKNIAKKSAVKPQEGPVFNLQATLQVFKDAAFVLADLSLERPSCYYELGLAEALGKPVYLIAIEKTDIHQTVSRRLVQYYKNTDEYSNLVASIISQASETS